MQTPATSIEALLEKTEVLSETTLELSKLKLLQTTTVLVTSLVSRMGVVMMLVLFIVMFTIGAALLIGERMEQPSTGFFIVAGVYLLLGLIFHFFLYKWIKKPFSEIIIHQSLQ